MIYTTDSLKASNDLHLLNRSIVNDKFVYLRTTKDEDQEWRLKHYNNLLSTRVLEDYRAQYLDFIFENFDKNEEVFLFKLNTPLAINLSSGLVENGGICLDRNSGAEVIYGSAIKGSARRIAIEKILYAETIAEKIDLAVKTMLVFGFSKDALDEMHKGDVYQAISVDISGEELKATLIEIEKRVNEAFKKSDINNSKGSVIFMQAVALKSVAENREKLELLKQDIISCHHTEYYDSKRNNFFDDEKPVPIAFITVRENTKFVFAFKAIKHKELFSFAKECLIESLKDGIGAKISAGYGSFSMLSDVDKNKFLKDIQDEQERRTNLIAQSLKEEEFKLKQAEEIRLKEATKKANAEARQNELEAILSTLNEEEKEAYSLISSNALKAKATEILTFSADESKQIVIALDIQDGNKVFGDMLVSLEGLKGNAKKAKKYNLLKQKMDRIIKVAKELNRERILDLWNAKEL